MRNINTKIQNFAWHQIEIHITQATPLRNGNYKGEGTISWDRESYHKNTNFHVVPKSHVSMFIKQTNTHEKRWLQRWREYKLVWNITTKNPKFKLNNLAMIPCKSHKSTTNKSGTYMVKVLSAKAQKQQQKIKNSRGANELTITTYHKKQPLGKRGLQR